jgi:hypothetical protein
VSAKLAADNMLTRLCFSLSRYFHASTVRKPTGADADTISGLVQYWLLLVAYTNCFGVQCIVPGSATTTTHGPEHISVVEAKGVRNVIATLLSAANRSDVCRTRHVREWTHLKFHVLYCCAYAGCTVLSPILNCHHLF